MDSLYPEALNTTESAQKVGMYWQCKWYPAIKGDSPHFYQIWWGYGVLFKYLWILPYGGFVASYSLDFLDDSCGFVYI